MNRKQKKRIKVIFRYDDYSSRSNTDIEVKLIDLFKNIDSPLTMGITPFVVGNDQHDPSPQDEIRLTKEKVRILKNGLRAGVIDAALHGYSHQTLDAKEGNEFSGLDYDTQLKKIAKGKDFCEELLNTKISAFLPPWNQYDINTLRALESLEFSTISPHKRGQVIETTQLKFLPWTCFISDLEEAVSSARKISYRQPLILVLLHEYDFLEVNDSRGIITIHEFGLLLELLASQDNVEIISLSQAAEMIEDLSVDRYISSQKKSPLRTLIASTLSEEGASKYLYPEKQIPKLTWLKVIGFYAFFLFLGLILSLFVNRYLLGNHRTMQQIITWLSVLITIMSFIYTFRDKYVYRRGMISNSGLLGTAIGFMISYLFK